MSPTFDVVPKRKRVNAFKIGKIWVFKQFFEEKELYTALSDNYNKDQ
jgi:hypothetical protein